MKKLSKLLVLATSTLCTLTLPSCEKKNYDGMVQIAIVDKGYGIDFLEKLVTEYNKDETHTKKVVIARSENVDSFISTSLLSGASSNPIDLYFSIESSGVYSYINQGYSQLKTFVLEDLSDLYDVVPEGYQENKPLKELINDYNYKSATYLDGKQYVIPWAMGVEGLVYNKALFQQYGYSIPRTTNEMFELFNKMKEDKEKGTHNVYAYSYSGKVNYGMYATIPWWIQYEGLDTFEHYLNGEDKKGNVTADILKQSGRLEAYKVYHDMIYSGNNSQSKKSNGYVQLGSSSKGFATAQMGFLKGQSFMMATGDWVEREMEDTKNVSLDNFAFMPIPVISSITDTKSALPDHSIADETTLREVVDYVRGTTTTKPVGVSDNDIDYMKDILNIYCSEGDAHVMFIPSYADEKEGAKEFLKFMMSKKGQEIQLSAGKGNMMPLDVDMNQFTAYSSLSNFQKSKFEVAQQVNYVGRRYNTPMTYAGGLRLTEGYSGAFADTAFGIDCDSGTYKTAAKYWADECAYYETKWDTMKVSAGIN